VLVDMISICALGDKANTNCVNHECNAYFSISALCVLGIWQCALVFFMHF